VNGSRIDLASPATGSQEALRVTTESGAILNWYSNGVLGIAQGLGLATTAFGVYLNTYGGQKMIGAITSKTHGVGGGNQGVELAKTNENYLGRPSCALLFGEPRYYIFDADGYDVNIAAGAASGTGTGGRLRLWAQPKGTVSQTYPTAAAVPALTVMPRGVVELDFALGEKQSRYQQNDLAVTDTSPEASDMASAAVAGQTYRIDAVLACTAGAAEGIVIGVTGPAITVARITATAVNTATGASFANTVTALGAVISMTGPESVIVTLTAVVRPSADGTLAITVAQANAGASPATLLALSPARFSEVF
jgi:hypothetical protein